MHVISDPLEIIASFSCSPCRFCAPRQAAGMCMAAFCWAFSSLPSARVHIQISTRAGPGLVPTRKP
ncbi:MAG: hypothetical protein NTU95_01870 [Methanothrix sp.]|nr:hypothetical protein [Methanothrix sp.]